MRTYFAIGVALVFLTACTNKDQKVSLPEKPKTACPIRAGAGFASPEDAFKAQKDALVLKDFCAYLHAFHPEDRTKVVDLTFDLIAKSIIGGGSPDNEKVYIPRFREVIQRYFPSGRPADSSKGPAESVADPGSLFVDLMGIFGNAPFDIPDGQLHDVKISGDQAKGEIRPSGKTGTGARMSFKKTPQGWFVQELSSYY